MTRPHCLSPEACKAAKPTTHCRSCSAARLRDDPEVKARRTASLRAALSDPAIAAKRVEHLRAYAKRRKSDPAAIEILRENGRRWGPVNIALTRGPESRAKAGRTHSDRALAWCPPAFRALYRELRNKAGCAATARAVVEAEMKRVGENWLDEQFRKMERPLGWREPQRLAA